jgi:hypothetical protein
MFKRHQTDPDSSVPGIGAMFRRRLEATQPIARSAVLIDRRPVRRRLVGSAAVGLRQRLALPALDLSRG